MLDDFDTALLDIVQRDNGRTAESLSRDVALSPSAIARRLRRLRSDGWIARTIALLSPRVNERRLCAAVHVQLAEHADERGKAALIERIAATEQIQFCYELAGVQDLLLLFNCGDMEEYNRVAESVLAADSAVRRFETSIVKRQLKFAPFVRLKAR
ncbi:MAG: Lrp/AsnC family transcriptional regulator [Pseudomonadota bacterium]|nr:Lrp/AsnC family transcriptional regulator [Pseudomonadota bacterium]